MDKKYLLEDFASGRLLEDEEVDLLDLEFEAELEGIRDMIDFEVAPDHICDAAIVSHGSYWISCLSAILDITKPFNRFSRGKTRGQILMNELVKYGHLVTD